MPPMYDTENTTSDSGRDDLVDVLRLALIPGVGPRIRQSLLECFGSAANVLGAAESELRQVPGVGPKLAKKIVGDEKNPYWIARKVYNYLTEHLEYEMVGGWDIPEVVLKRGSGSCSEYTFSFVALCRAAGLPARYQGSVVVRGDDASIDEAFHRWAQVYLPIYGWVPVDGRDPVEGWVPVEGRVPALGTSVFDQLPLSRRSQPPLSLRR